MKKNTIATIFVAAGMFSAGLANAATIDIGTSPVSKTVSQWIGNTFKQQDKLWTLISDANTSNLDATTVLNFSLDAGAGADNHKLQIVPFNYASPPPGTLPQTIKIHYTIAIDAATAPNAYFTAATLGIDTSGTGSGQSDAFVTKILNDGAIKNKEGNNLLAYNGSNVPSGQAIVSGTTTKVIDVKETLQWNAFSFASASNTFSETGVPPLPEPDSIALFGIGLGAMFFGRRRKS
jgi:hypothetical protein